MKPRTAVKNLMPPKRALKKIKTCGYFHDNETDKITHVMVPLELFQKQFDNFNEDSLFFEIYEYIEAYNEEKE